MIDFCFYFYLLSSVASIVRLLCTDVRVDRSVLTIREDYEGLVELMRRHGLYGVDTSSDCCVIG